MCVCVHVCVRVGWGFLRCMCRDRGHMIPTRCGSDWPGLGFVFAHVLVLLKSRVAFRKITALSRSYRLG